MESALDHRLAPVVEAMSHRSTASHCDRRQGLASQNPLSDTG